MKVEEIPADSLVEMSELFHRAFNAAGCDPACHCCGKPIPIGAKFKLGTVESIPHVSTNHPDTLQKAIDEYENRAVSREVMLCDKCTPKMYKNRAKHVLANRKETFKGSPGKWGCFRINGKIVH